MDHITRRWRFRITILLVFFASVFIFGICFLISELVFEINPAIVPSSVATIAVDEIIVHPTYYDGYLYNPGMGWQTVNSERVNFPESVVYANRDMITWKILNPAEGVYNWAPLSEGIAQAATIGKQFSFRVFTISGESYGPEEVPDWVLQKGALIRLDGEPDYSNCVYQQEWGKFVTELLAKYDGNPSIAYIDISGYGNFNEWSWQDQTEWDTVWDENYRNGTASSITLQTLDGQARRRLADIFIGGSFSSHQCRDASGNILQTSYAYIGAQKTQLIMPYAGIPLSTLFVFLMR